MSSPARTEIGIAEAQAARERVTQENVDRLRREREGCPGG
jgi:hypothetical protein